ncbi:MAG: HPr family phosphocarrier protein [Balneolaceae bacterium]
MIERNVTLRNRAGLHARPSSVLVKKAAEFESDFFVELSGYRVNGKSILGLMTLAAEEGSQMKLILDGPDEEEAAEAIAALFENRFHQHD